MMTTRCEACGVVPAHERVLEPCETPESTGFMEKVCIMHSLCDDCFARYQAMDTTDQERFREHLTAEGLGVVLEL